MAEETEETPAPVLLGLAAIGSHAELPGGAELCDSSMGVGGGGGASGGGRGGGGEPIRRRDGDGGDPSPAVASMIESWIRHAEAIASGAGGGGQEGGEIRAWTWLLAALSFPADYVNARLMRTVHDELPSAENSNSPGDAGGEESRLEEEDALLVVGSTVVPEAGWAAALRNKIQTTSKILLKRAGLDPEALRARREGCSFASNASAAGAGTEPGDVHPEGSRLVLSTFWPLAWGQLERENKRLEQDLEETLARLRMCEEERGLFRKELGVRVRFQASLTRRLQESSTRVNSQREQLNVLEEQLERERLARADALSRMSDCCVCPVNYNLMEDPVIVDAPCRHTANRDAVMQWYRLNNSTCPMCGTRLNSMDLSPNVPLMNVAEEIRRTRQGEH